MDLYLMEISCLDGKAELVGMVMMERSGGMEVMLRDTEVRDGDGGLYPQDSHQPRTRFENLLFYLFRCFIIGLPV